MEWSRVRWDSEGKEKDEIKQVQVGSGPEILERGLLRRWTIRSIGLPVEQPGQFAPCQVESWAQDSNRFARDRQIS